MKTRPSVRIQCRSRADAQELALRLEADGYGTARRWKAVIARTRTHDEAEQLARKLRVDGRSGGTPVWEVRAKLATAAGLASAGSASSTMHERPGEAAILSS